MNSLKNLLTKNKKISPFSALIFLVTIVGALFVRLYGLSEYAFGDDELWHLTVANQENLWQVIKYNFVEEVHPPLSYMIWHLMLQVSDNDLWLRMSGIIPAILLIPSMYLFGQRYIGRAAGYFLALLFAFGAMPVAISQTIRAYSLMMLVLTWAAIFVHKYCFETEAKSRNKFLLFYALTALVAIQLHHAACFTLFALGLVLVFQTFKEKNKKDFFVIAAIHAPLAILVVGYAYVLKTYFGFNGNLGFFTTKEWTEYFWRYLVMFLQFLFADSTKGYVVGLLAFPALAASFVAPVALIRARKWLLLNLIFTPFLVVVICDYFRLYPFSPTPRNNLFLFFGIAIIYAYFVQILANYFSKFYQNKNLLQALALLLVILSTTYAFKQNSFRALKPNCVEFSIKKTDMNLAQSQLRQRNKSGNVFVTVTRNMWHYRMQNGDKNHITILTKNLAKFENDEITIYFTAFPAREFSTAGSMLDYKLFFQDLFNYLGQKGEFSKVKSFTFFDIGLKVEYLATLFHPQMVISAKDFGSKKIEYKRWQERYEMGWTINTSKEVLDKFYIRDTKFDCGREIVLLSVTPKFVKDEILSKDFINWRKFDEEEVLKRND